MKKKNRIILLIIVAILIAAIFLPIPIPINRVVQGMECRIGDSEYAIPKTIEIHGTYYLYVFKEDVYEGQFTIEGYDKTKAMSCYAVFELITPLTYHNYSNLKYEQLEMFALGIMNNEAFFSRFLIGVHEANSVWPGESGLYISAPAQNRSEALNLAMDITRNDEWWSNIKWD